MGFRDTFGENFSTREVQVKTCLKTLRDMLRDDPKLKWPLNCTPDCVRELLKERACEIEACEIDVQDAYGQTPLMMAVQGRQIQDRYGSWERRRRNPGGCGECLKILLDNNANAELTNRLGETALHYALGRESDPGVLELLMKKMQ